jgi:glyoxylase-like metal-dependent hydrolase (beta-lactamase superfamily II)
VRVIEIATGLWYWTGLHPGWTPADGGPDGWEQEVGCVYLEAPDSVVLFDPLVPTEDPTRFHQALDRDVARTGRPVRVLLTTASHERSAAELAQRHGGTIGELPAGVEIAAEAWDETVYLIPEHAALVVGDVLLGRDGGVSLPRAWLGDDYAGVAAALRPLLDLPVERVLVTHGEPVLSDGHAALAAALARSPG